MTVSMRDVAKRAGVAVGTVSRVLNEHPGVDPILRERVEAAMKALRYRVTPWGRGLARKSLPCVSFILNNRNFLHPVHSRILQGVEEECDAADCFVVYTKFQYRPEVKTSELRLPRVLRSHAIGDSVILAGTNYENLIEALEDLRTPYVLLANNLISSKERRPFDQVRWDDFGGAYTATKYLIDLGHRDIWYIGDVSLPWFRVPYEGYQQAMADSGLEPLGQTAALSDDGFRNGKASVDLLIERKRPLTAIFADCVVAHGAQEALRLHGLYTPRDVSIVALGEEDHWSAVAPLTTVRIDMVEVGRALARMALAKIKSPHREFPEVVIPGDLVKHGTCQPYPSTRSTILQPATISRSRQPSLKSLESDKGKDHRRRRNS